MRGKADIDARLAQHIAVIDGASLVFCPKRPRVFEARLSHRGDDMVSAGEQLAHKLLADAARCAYDNPRFGSSHVLVSPAMQE